MSPSSRRAWIEMTLSLCRVFHREVALLAEGVDRNFCGMSFYLYVSGSPSSRRAWIEMFVECPAYYFACVALLAEGVDRNVIAS